jgi:hypothetical protein
MDYIIISKEDYDTKMLNLLEKIAEGNVPAAYVDPKGIPTIGIGINLRANLDSVLEWFGVDMDNLSTADATIVEKIRQTVNKSYTYGPAGDASLNNAIAPLFQQLSQKNRTTFAKSLGVRSCEKPWGQVLQSCISCDIVSSWPVRSG